MGRGCREGAQGERVGDGEGVSRGGARGGRRGAAGRPILRPGEAERPGGQGVGARAAPRGTRTHARGVDAVLVGDDLPELGADLVAALAALEVDDLAHLRSAARGERGGEEEDGEGE